MRRKKNIAIYVALAEKGMWQYELAHLLGCSEGRVSILLREELPEEKQKEIIEMIKKGANNE